MQKSESTIHKHFRLNTVFHSILDIHTNAVPYDIVYMVIYVSLTILTEHGTLSLFSWYLKAKLSLLMRFITYNFDKIYSFFCF